MFVNMFRVVCIGSKLAEADSLMTWSRDGAVKLRMTDTENGSLPPITVMEALKETVDRVPNRIGLGEFLSVQRLMQLTYTTET